MNLFVDTMSGKIVHISTEAKADETDTPIPGGDVTVETGNGTETFHTYNNYDDILPDGMTVDKFCTLLAKYWGFSGYRLAQTDDAMFHYAQLNPGGGEAADGLCRREQLPDRIFRRRPERHADVHQP